MKEPLGPQLGALASPHPAGRHDDLRLAMIDQLVARNGERPLGGSDWLEIWESAATELRDRVIERARAELAAAARRSKYPSGRLAAAQPTSDQIEQFRNRLLAEGDQLERLESDNAGAAVQQKRASALLDSWNGATRLAHLEQLAWQRKASVIAGWQRPWTPIVVAAAVLVPVAVVTAAWLGGLLPAPEWFQPVNARFWNVPWL